MKYTHRTRDGRKARIVCNDVEGSEFPVLALVLIERGEEKVENFYSYTSGLCFHESQSEDPLDLFEISPWDDVAVDTPIWVKHRADWPWHKMHFAEYKCGKVRAWSDGKTSHTVYDVAMDYDGWPFATLENPNGN